ncbi:MAG TPA: cytochrome C oxidase subunit IV family protein [Caulobacteraceae bacterium]|jgi:cytochrome c oxidase subunit 4
MAREIRLYVLVWVALMALLTATVALTFAPIGPFKTASNLGIAAIKAALVFWVYMHLSRRPGLERIAAVAAIAWLGILLTLTGTDIVSRGWFQG